MIIFNNKQHGYAIAEAASCQFNASSDPVIARVGQGKLLGGVIYKGFNGHSINAHFAGFNPVWANRDMLWVGFHYPFVQLGCKKLFAEIPSSNSKSLEICLKLGFIEVVRIPEVFSDIDDLIILVMDRSSCRWLSLKPRTLQGGGT